MGALPNIPPPFSVRTLAQRWGCSEGAIRKRIAEGSLHTFRIGVLIRIAASEVMRIEQCQITPSNDSEADGRSCGAPETESGIGNSLPRLTEQAPRLRLASDGGSRKAPQAPWER